MGYDESQLRQALRSIRTSPGQWLADVRTLGWKLARAGERPPFYRTRMKTRNARRGHG
jgi:hypothetical protein